MNKISSLKGKETNSQARREDRQSGMHEIRLSGRSGRHPERHTNRKADWKTGWQAGRKTNEFVRRQKKNHAARHTEKAKRQTDRQIGK